jgi:hypothetical protein
MPFQFTDQTFSWEALVLGTVIAVVIMYYQKRKEKRKSDENKTIGILLCTDKNNAVVKMTLPEDNDQVFASKYKLYLPSKEELLKQLNI